MSKITAAKAHAAKPAAKKKPSSPPRAQKPAAKKSPSSAKSAARPAADAAETGGAQERGGQDTRQGTGKEDAGQEDHRPRRPPQACRAAAPGGEGTDQDTRCEDHRTQSQARRQGRRREAGPRPVPARLQDARRDAAVAAAAADLTIRRPVRAAPAADPTDEQSETDMPKHAHKADPKLANNWKTKAGRELTRRRSAGDARLGVHEREADGVLPPEAAGS